MAPKKISGMNLCHLDGQEWLCGSFTQIHKVAEEYIKDSLWAFNSCYIVDFLTGTGHFHPEWNTNTWQNFQNTLKGLQEKFSEEANPFIESLLGSDLDQFIQTAIDDDGAEHFIHSYDEKIYKTKDVPGLKHGYGPYCFRVN